MKCYNRVHTLFVFENVYFSSTKASGFDSGLSSISPAKSPFFKKNTEAQNILFTIITNKHSITNTFHFISHLTLHKTSVSAVRTISCSCVCGGEREAGGLPGDMLRSAREACYLGELIT